jgi:hypothetical protein
MGRVCTVCTHADRQTIDEEIVAGQPNRAVARHHGVSRDAVARHHHHISRALVSVQRRREERGAESLADRVEELFSRAQAILSAAEEDGRATVALGAIRELRGIVELLGRLTGELSNQALTGTTINIITSPTWVLIRSAVIDALAEHPEARAAVAGRLLELGAAS